MTLVTAQARDAVTAFLDTTFVQANIRGLDKAATVPVEDPQETVKVVAALSLDGSTPTSSFGRDWPYLRCQPV
jgi:hypothetical protein